MHGTGATLLAYNLQQPKRGLVMLKRRLLWWAAVTCAVLALAFVGSFWLLQPPQRIDESFLQVVPGMTRMEVVKLLAHPDESNQLADVWHGEDHSLYVTFDRNGTVKKTRVTGEAFLAIPESNHGPPPWPWNLLSPWW